MGREGEAVRHEAGVEVESSDHTQFVDATRDGAIEVARSQIRARGVERDERTVGLPQESVEHVIGIQVRCGYSA